MLRQIFRSIFDAFFCIFPAPKLGKDSRSRSMCVSDPPMHIGNSNNACRRGSKAAFLLKQRGSGEETMITLTPLGVNPNSVHTILGGPKRGLKGSLNSLEMDEANRGEFQVSPEALEAQRVEKLVRNLRRQVSVTQEDAREDISRWVFSHVKTRPKKSRGRAAMKG